ncbi:Dual specificity phosphatase 26 [Seminavis robusta]|uniref:protein-serine/threonine phosphatase n=1 Tax=Seminavis robusta TaxID=568900 RepID=A0A9N8DLX0_9STRA|nr:Dual specificity phosphatase 26 [Seminavis robusta]|eukprot:Sro216_g089530.1 Dual specificity phosphatase 26 (251) ;mRNA; f:78142-78894
MIVLTLTFQLEPLDMTWKDCFLRCWLVCVKEDDKEEERDQDNNDEMLRPWMEACRDILENGDLFMSTPKFPIELLPWLYLSDLHTARKVQLLRDQGITHVLSTNRMPLESIQAMTREYKSHGILHKAVPGEDHDGYDMIGSHWKDCGKFMERAKRRHQQPKVLVHCAHGSNRSALIAAAAMLLLNDDNDDNDNNPPLVRLVRTLSEKRGRVLTNRSFQKQLCLLAKQEGKLGPKPTISSKQQPRTDGKTP